MAPTTQDVVEEESGSRSGAGRQRSYDYDPGSWQRTHDHEPAVVSGSRSRAGRRRRRTHHHEPTVTDDLSGGTQPEAEPSSQRGTRKTATEQSESEGERRKRRRKRSRKKKAATSASPGASHASSASEASSSPPRFPREPNPDDFGGRSKPEYHAAIIAYDDLLSKYREKRRRQLELVTLDPYKPFSSMVNLDLRSVRESATKTVLQVARVVFSLSSYVDGKLMARISGFLIDWDKESKTGTVLTSARIICSKYTPRSQWSGTDEYSPNAEVVAHLLDKDDTTVTAQLLRFDKHINMALFLVGLESCAEIPTFNIDVKYGHETFVIGRNEKLDLTVDHEHVAFLGPSGYERHHYMFTEHAIRKSSIGGPVIDLNGQVLGMANFPGAAFIPSSIILSCLDMWKKYQCIPRLHIGMKFSPIKCLDPTHVERIFRKCSVDSGLIVRQVSCGSVADKLGVRPGDIINCIDGECIATTVELEKLTMRICQNHLDQGGTIGSWVDVPVGIVHMRKGDEVRSRRTLRLRLNVSDEMEVFARE